MKDKEILEKLISENVIPAQGTFEVTPFCIQRFSSIYYDLYGRKDNRFKSKNERYCKKLAGLSLMKLNFSRHASEENLFKVVKPEKLKQKCGILYMITNPAWPGVAKIGITQDMEKRLNQYQTSDPYRKFKVEHSIFVVDIRKTESYFLRLGRSDMLEGEWIDHKLAQKLILSYTE